MFCYVLSELLKLARNSPMVYSNTVLQYLMQIIMLEDKVLALVILYRGLLGKYRLRAIDNIIKQPLKR